MGSRRKGSSVWPERKKPKKPFKRHQKFPVISREEERALLEAYFADFKGLTRFNRRTKSKVIDETPEQIKIRWQLVQGNIGMVYHVADAFQKRWRLDNVEFDDLVQVGCLAIYDSIPNFDMERPPVKLCTFCDQRIRSEMKNVLKRDRNIRIPLTITPDCRQFADAAHRTGTITTNVIDRQVEPDFTYNLYEQYDTADYRRALRVLMPTLTPREQVVLCGHLADHSQVYTGKLIGVCRERARTILANVCEKARTVLRGMRAIKKPALKPAKQAA